MSAAADRYLDGRLPPPHPMSIKILVAGELPAIRAASQYA